MCMTSRSSSDFSLREPRDGTIRVSLRLQPAGRGELTVEDDGVGLNATPTLRGTGLGTRIVKALASAIDIFSN